MHVFTDVHRPPVLLPTLRLTCNSADMHVHVCVSMWTCFRLLCLYVHRPVFEYSEHTSVGRYESHVYVTDLCAGHLCDQVPILCLSCWLSCPVLSAPTQGGFRNLEI